MATIDRRKTESHAESQRADSPKIFVLASTDAVEIENRIKFFHCQNLRLRVGKLFFSGAAMKTYRMQLAPTASMKIQNSAASQVFFESRGWILRAALDIEASLLPRAVMPTLRFCGDRAQIA